MKRASQLVSVVVLAIACLLLAAPALGAVAVSVPVTIDHDRKTINFKVRLHLYPSCPELRCSIDTEVTDAIGKNISDAWNNGSKYKCYKIVVDVRIERGSATDIPGDQVGVRIDRSPAPIRSQVSVAGSTGRSPDGSSASDRLAPVNDGRTIWAHPPQSTNTYAHEVGHVLGLDDTYRDVNGRSVDIDGTPHDLMNTGMLESNSIAQVTIDRLVNRAGINESKLRCGWTIDEPFSTGTASGHRVGTKCGDLNGLWTLEGIYRGLGAEGNQVWNVSIEGALPDDTFGQGSFTYSDVAEMTMLGETAFLVGNIVGDADVAIQENGDAKMRLRETKHTFRATTTRGGEGHDVNAPLEVHTLTWRFGADCPP